MTTPGVGPVAGLPARSGNRQWGCDLGPSRDGADV